MGSINRSTRVSRPPEQVFALLRDVRRLPEFSDMTVEVRNGPERPVDEGDTFEQVVRLVGKQLDTEWRVVAVEPPRRLQVEGTAMAGARATLVETLEPDGDGTRLTLDVDYDLPLGALGEALDAAFLHSKAEEQAEEILAKLVTVCERS